MSIRRVYKVYKLFIERHYQSGLKQKCSPLIYPMKKLYFNDLARLATYLQRYHVGKGRMVTVTEGPGCLMAGGPAVHPVGGPTCVYNVTIYEGRITGKLRQAIRVVEIAQDTYRGLAYHINAESGFYFGQLDSFVNTLLGRRRKLLAIQAVVNAD